MCTTTPTLKRLSFRFFIWDLHAVLGQFTDTSRRHPSEAFVHGHVDLQWLHTNNLWLRMLTDPRTRRKMNARLEQHLDAAFSPDSISNAAITAFERLSFAAARSARRWEKEQRDLPNHSLLWQPRNDHLTPEKEIGYILAWVKSQGS